MKTTINRENILAPLQQVIGAVERRQTIPVLGNVLLKSSGGDLTLTATDLEIEMVARIEKGIESIDGVAAARTVSIEYDEGEIDQSGIEAWLTRSGYPPSN